MVCHYLRYPSLACGICVPATAHTKVSCIRASDGSLSGGCSFAAVFLNCCLGAGYRLPRRRLSRLRHYSPLDSANDGLDGTVSGRDWHKAVIAPQAIDEALFPWT
jgi:hypothetical protein